MTNLLENVLSDVESDENVVSDANEYRRILNYITKKFGLNNHTQLKRQKSEDSNNIYRSKPKKL